jgi:hypothetical protein
MLGIAQNWPFAPPLPQQRSPATPFSGFRHEGVQRADQGMPDHLRSKREALIYGLAQWESHSRSGLAQNALPGRVLPFSPKPGVSSLQPRSRELAWRRANEPILRSMAGEWVVLEGEELIAHGPDPQPLVQDAKRRGIRVPYLFFVEPAVGRVARIGL